MRVFSWILLILLVVWINNVYAERLSLKEAVSVAVREHPLLKAYKWSLEGQKEDVGAAKGHLYPKVKIEERFMNTDNPTYAFMAKLNQGRFSEMDFEIHNLNNPSSISDFQTSISIEQPLYTPRVSIGIELAAGEIDARRVEYEQKREDISFEVVRTYLMVQTADRYVEAARRGIEDAMEHRRLASLRYDAGAGLYSDVLRAEVSLKEAEKMLIRAESNSEIARRALGLLLGRTEPVDVEDDKPALPLNAIETYLDASAERKDVAVLERRHENALKTVRLERSVYLPEVGIGGSFQFNDHNIPLGTEGSSYMLTAFLRWNIFDATFSHRIRKAEVKANEVGEYLNDIRKEINFSIHESYSKVKEAGKHISLTRAALNEAEEAQRLVRLRYENSLAPVVDLLDTQVMLDSVRARVVEAENEYLTSLAALYYKSGILLKELLRDKEQGG